MRWCFSLSAAAIGRQEMTLQIRHSIHRYGGRSQNVTAVCQIQCGTRHCQQAHILGLNFEAQGVEAPQPGASA